MDASATGKEKWKQGIDALSDSQQEMGGKILSRLGDPLFRERLKSHPKETLASVGIAVNDDTEVVFYEAGQPAPKIPGDKVIAIPLAGPIDGELSESELDQVAGGRGPASPTVNIREHAFGEVNNESSIGNDQRQWKHIVPRLR